jgi:hypothetical protein
MGYQEAVMYLPGKAGYLPKDQSQNGEEQDKDNKCPAIGREVIVILNQECFELLHK